MDTIEQLLDRLSEYASQRDMIEMRKRELLDTVKVPAEILAAQDMASQERNKIDWQSANTAKEIQAATVQLMSEVVEPEIPAEFAAAIAAARQQREDIQSQATARYDALQKKLTDEKSRVDAKLQEQTAQVYADIQRRKLEIEAEFIGQVAAVDANIEKLTAQIKAETVKHGSTVKGGQFMAVYVKGRVTWMTEKLDGMMALIPQLKEARKEGAPSITIRKI